MDINYYQNTNPLKKGDKRYVISYSGFGVFFRTDVDAVDESTAKAYFSKYFPRAKFESIKLKHDPN
ncbi:hypothetical protein [Pseudotamlana carrageenivorans]|uniref:Uncharacterized protein n=1 Tax=Pseudotamlana carrageenivorans TaxID=2069432 RepID=A0A2I7SKN9_9FLAO|nr:hypothetical protein [Tamlana carrageenivorans]AUS06463.1 hypothetical protein C1A40_13860 [Tamlana carrageenivorans]